VNSHPLTVIHVEDDPLWSDLVAGILSPLPFIRHFAVFRSATEGLAAAQRLRPDCALVDLNLPQLDGFELAELLVRQSPTTRILLVSVRSDDATLARLNLPHLGGLVWKSTSLAEQLPRALVEVTAGRKYFAPEVRESVRRLRADSQAFFKILSDREIGLLPLFGLGLSDREIADRTELSPLTIKSHRQHIMAKVGLHRSAELIHWAIQRGFVAAPALAPDRVR